MWKLLDNFWFSRARPSRWFLVLSNSCETRVNSTCLFFKSRCEFSYRTTVSSNRDLNSTLVRSRTSTRFCNSLAVPLAFSKSMIKTSTSLWRRLFCFSKLFILTMRVSICSSCSWIRAEYLRRISSTSSARAADSASNLACHCWASPVK